MEVRCAVKSARILVFGDSIAQGYNDAENGGWVRLLQRDYVAEDMTGKSCINIINLSVSGHTSQELVTRIESETSTRKNNDKMVIIIAIGTNDSYEKSGIRRTPEADFAQNIDHIIAVAKSFGKVLMIGPVACVDKRVQPTAWDEELHYTNERLQKYSTILCERAEHANVSFLELWDTMYRAQQHEETLPDGLHPNTAGHKVIYNEVKKKLEEMI